MEITLKIDARSKQAKAFLTYLKTLPFITLLSKEKTTAIDKSLKELEKGDLNTYKSVDDFFKKVVA